MEFNLIELLIRLWMGGRHIYDLKHDMHWFYKQRLNKFIQTGTASGVCKTVMIQLEIERSDNSQR